MMKIQPVVLCGGSGTRLWPLSREQHPKQLLALNGDLSLLQETLRRMDGLAIKPAPAAAPVVLCQEEYRFLVNDQLRAIGAQARSIILEPAGKGTAPALTLAALHVVKDDDPVLLVMPSDHVIERREAFHDAIRRGAALAAEGCIVTFGIPPAAPETGYGYIRVGNELYPGRTPPAYDVDSFVEKPDGETAQRYAASGSYLWNSGIFMVRGSIWLEVLGRLRPEMLAACELAHGQGARDGDFYHIDARAFEECPQDSIDYAVMERVGPRRAGSKGPRAAAVRLEAGWSDVGAWDALWQIGGKDGDGNVVHGDVCAVDTRKALLIARHRLLACVGLEDVVVIETADAVMVARRDQAQAVKQVVSRLKSQGRRECVTHRKVHRPWGSYESVDGGERFQVKRIIVNPGAALSLQIHYHRAEHWIVVRGTARVTRGDQAYLLTENQSTYIPLGVKHRLENPGRVPLEIIEVQSGAYLGEDDIVRFEDTYGRAEKSQAAGVTPAPSLSAVPKPAAGDAAGPARSTGAKGGA
ncbi:MAG TPA: mannose-1-phosphate guanylyltransferase/mannose-6-phosphate isomerase [Burkholderiales bacterium]|nr:mannose-1-phosphate guanylyltransferase/mannose-6-phosphate isomerase [Burkholderiales bacterium]